MSRAGNVDVVTVKPANNVYTVLTLVAFLVVFASFLVLYFRARTVFGGGLFD
jgi:hypothetical protein